MSTIAQTGKKIKKKLSIEDYSTPISHELLDQTSLLQAHTYAQASADESLNSPASIASQHTSIPAYQHTSKTVSQQDSKLASQHAGKTTYQYANKPVNQHDSKLASNDADIPAKKSKVTFYLDETTNKLLLELYIKHLQAHQKIDKSTLICQAIELLHKNKVAQENT